MAEVDGGDIIIRIRGDASDLEAEVDRAQGALSDLESGADDTSGSLGSMAGAAGTAGKAMQGLSRGGINGVAMGLSAVNPAAGKLVRMLGYLRYATGPLVLVLGAAAAAVKLVTDEQDRLKRVSEANTVIAEGLAASNLKLQTSLEDLAVATGDLTAEELELLRARRQTFTESLPAIQKTAAALFEEKNRTRELAEQIASLEEQAAGASAALAGDFDGSLSRVASTTIGVTAKLEKARAELVESARRTESLTEAQTTQMENLKGTIQAIELKIAAEQRATIATNAQAEADKRAEQAATQRAESVASYMDTLSEQSATINAEVSAGIDEAVANMEQAILEIEAAIVRDQEAIGAGVSDSLNAVSSLSSTLSDQLAEDNEKAAKAMHRTSQAAGLANVAINTSVAIMKALAELGPIAGPIAATGIGLTGAAQAAAIAAQPPPSAHIGSGMPGSRDPLAPDERMSGGRRILSTEASGPGGVANSMGTQLLNDVNTGRVQSSGRITAVIGRTHLDQELFRSGRRGTSRYARALRTNPHPKPQGGY